MDNNVIATTKLRAYPGWVVREYADGMFDAADTRSPGLSPGFDSFAACVEHVRSQVGSRPASAKLTREFNSYFGPMGR